MAPVKCITFDLDDTLWDHRRAQDEALEATASRLFPADRAERFIDRFHHHNGLLWEEYKHGRVEATTVKEERFARALVDLSSDPATAPKIAAEFLDLYSGLPYLRPGARDTLTHLGRRLPLGCLTDGFTNAQRRKLDASGLGEVFSFVLTSEEVGAAKPAPPMFDAARQRAGCDAGSIVHVGDSLEKDVGGAKVSGFRAAWLSLSPELPGAAAAALQPDWVIEDLRELPALLGIGGA